MAQKILIVLTALAALVLNIAQANSAQLSTNPWLEANDDEAVAEVYRKEQRRQNLRSLNYQAEGTATIDRTHAYIQDAGENGATEGRRGAGTGAEYRGKPPGAGAAKAGGTGAAGGFRLCGADV